MTNETETTDTEPEAPATTEVVRAKVAFRAGAALVDKGDLFEADSDVVVGREHLFTAVGGTVRTTSTVPGPVTSPPPFLDDKGDGENDSEGEGEDGGDGPQRPAESASKALWQAYLVELGHIGDTDGLNRADLITIAAEFEAASRGE